MSRIHEALIRAEQDQNNGSSASTVSRLHPLELSLLRQPVAASEPDAGVSATETPAPGLFSQFCRPTWTAPHNNMLFLDAAIETTPCAEQFRAFRSRLYRIRQKQPLKTILVTSSLPREGKSFVSANLSQIFAQQSGCRTLLIDADLRWSRLHEYLGAPSNPGLPDYLAGTVDVSAIVQQSPVPDLFFIPGGQARNPAELIGNGRIKQLLNDLAPFFDWIVMDAPPASVVSDVAALADIADGIVFVVRSGFTNFRVAQKAREELKDRPLLGVVLNALPKDGDSHSYYYDAYYTNSQQGNSKRNGNR